MAIFLKGTIGVAPFVGPMLTELISVTIPNQKADRLITFVEVLEFKLKHIQQDVLEQKLKTEEIADLFEDGFRLASRALTDERRHYIASFLKNGLSADVLTHIEKKSLLALLEQLNDVEVLILKYESLRGDKQREFWDLHETSLRYPRAVMGSSQEAADREAVNKNYRSHLAQLELLLPWYVKPKKGEIPEFDETTGRLKFQSYKITRLGMLLLHHIDLGETPSEETGGN